jgi:hypothetical protein
MYLTRSSDAEKFNEPQRLGMLHWKLNACPMDGGDLTIGAMNQPIATWRQQNAIFLTVSDADEQIGAGRQPVVAVNGSGTYLAWISPGAELVTQTPGGSPHTLTQNANDPVLIAPKEGDRAYLLWEADKKILATVLTPAGQ